ncbi:MAG: hypothetical protein N3A65_05030 [candidate division WOR-3 bacterium]|nr:hypothetical protein [candidate division WOR-3 bacterium]
MPSINSIIVFILLLLMVPGNSLILKSGNDVCIGSEDTVIDDDIIALGRSINIKGTVNGDVFALGQMVDIKGKIDGSVITSGSEIKVQSSGIRSLIAFCGRLDLEGIFDHNLIFFGGELNTDSSFLIKKDLIAYGGEVDLEGAVKGKIKGSAGRFNIGGEIQKGQIESDEVNIKSNAVVKGDLTVKGKKEPRIESGANITGRIKFEKAGEKSAAGKKGTGFVKILKTVFFIGKIVIGIILIALFQKHFKKMNVILRDSTWKSLGSGFLTIIVLPVAIVITLATIIGIPVAIFGIFVFLTFVYLSSIIFATGFGEWLIKLIKKEGEISPFVSFIAGLVIVTLASMIPYLGFFIRLVVLFMGTGMIVILLRKLWLDSLKTLEE